VSFPPPVVYAVAMVRRAVHTGAVVLVAAFTTGCATLQQIAALRQVDFAIDRVSEVRLAGIDLTAKRSYTALSLSEAATLASAVARNDLPLAFNLHLRALNPAENRVSARMIQMHWTLLLEDHETVSGVVQQEYVLPPGTAQDLPIAIELNLTEFFQRNARDLFELALNLAGQGGAPKNVTLRAVPTIQTAIGPIQYPQPITIVSREIGR
jgi:hypothetical protein